MNAALEPIWRAMPHQAGPEQDAGRQMPATALLPADAAVPLHGLAHHAAMHARHRLDAAPQPIEASPEQIRQFAALFANNARAVQMRNRRYLLQTS